MFGLEKWFGNKEGSKKEKNNEKVLVQEKE